MTALRPSCYVEGNVTDFITGRLTPVCFLFVCMFVCSSDKTLNVLRPLFIKTPKRSILKLELTIFSSDQRDI